MALVATHKETVFGIGDIVRVHILLISKSKEDLPAQARKGGRTQIFEGVVIAIRGKAEGKSFVVRRVGELGIGIEQIFPLSSPLLEKVEVVRQGKRGVRQAKLYYVRGKSKREIEKIYSRARRRAQAKQAPKKVAKKKSPKKSK
jgi:large subunit ribosomal protein L19